MYYYQQSFSLIDDEQNEVMGAYHYTDMLGISTASTHAIYYDARRNRDDFFPLSTVRLMLSRTDDLDCAVFDLEVIQPRIHEMKALIQERQRDAVSI